MAFGSVQRDAGNIPISQEYVPGVGFVALEGHRGAAKDASGNQTTSAVMSYIQPSLVQQANAVTGSAGLTLNVVFGSATTVGNTIIVSVGCGIVQSGSTITLAVTDNQGNTYTQAVFGSFSTTLESSVFYAPITTAGATTVTITLAGASATNTGIAAEIYEVAGLLAHVSSGPLDQSSSGNSSGSTAVTGGTVTPTQGNEYVFMAMATGGGTITIGPGLTLDSGTLAPTGGGSFVSFGAAHGYLSSTFSFQGTATLNSVHTSSACMATFRTAGVPVTGTVSLAPSSANIGTTGTFANPNVTSDLLQRALFNGQMFAGTAFSGLFNLPNNRYYPVCLFNPAGSGKTVLIYSIFLVYGFRTGGIDSNAACEVDVNTVTTDPVYPSSMSIGNLKLGAGSSVMSGTYSVTGIDGLTSNPPGSRLESIGYANGILNQASELMTNGKGYLLPPGNGLIYSISTFSPAQFVQFNIAMRWIEF